MSQWEKVDENDYLVSEICLVKILFPSRDLTGRGLTEQYVDRMEFDYENDLELPPKGESPLKVCFAGRKYGSRHSRGISFSIWQGWTRVRRKSKRGRG